MKSAIFFTTLVLLSCMFLKCVSTDACEEYPPYCYESSCYCVNINQSISSLWTLPKRTTPLISQLRSAIKNNVYEVDQKQFALLYPQTTWTVNILTDFDASISPSCVFSNMISESLDSMKSGCTHNLKQPLIDYGHLVNYAIIYGIAVGLSAAGCPVEMGDYKSCSETICPIEQSFYDFLSLNPNKFPQEVKEVIINLSKSSNADDRLTALAVVASGTEISIKLFKELIKSEELLNSIQLKSCSFDLPLKCCPLREHEITIRSILLRKLVSNVVKRMLCH